MTINLRLLNQHGLNLTADTQDKFISLHGLSVTFVWLLLAIIGLWTQAFKQYKWANWIHTIAMGAAILITLISGIFASFILDGVQVSDFHTGLGGILLIALLVQGLSGCITWVLQVSSRIRPDVVSYVNLAHHILGYVILFLIGILIIQVAFNSDIGISIAAIIVDIIGIFGYLIFSFTRAKMQKYNTLPKKSDKDIPQIKNSRELAKYHGNYFIFADRVYNLDRVISNHPGGYEVINHTRGRQVDRFIFGSEALQSVGQMKVHSHTAVSMAMAGQPIGVFMSLNPYSHMSETNDVILEKLTTPCKNKQIHAPYLSSRSQPFVFKGYEDLSQLGKYITVTINNKKTRLYSCVNFIHQSNLKLMNRIHGRNYFSSQINEKQVTMEDMIPSNRSLQKNYNTIPLLIKKYEKGQFTQQFLNESYDRNIKISPPRGRGLNLHEMHSGNIIFLAGGTGIFPFCDTIDLLYKELLVSKNNVHSQQIIQKNPLVSNRTLMKKFKFSMLLSVQSIDDIHQMTLFQMNQLAANHIMSIQLKVSKKSDMIKRTYPAINLITERFQHYLPQIVQSIDKISHIYLCGPPAMNSNLVKNMDTLNVPIDKYLVL